MSQHQLFCETCRAGFVVTEHDKVFLQKVSPQFGPEIQSLEIPHLCAACREQQRLAFRNEWNMYRRRCDASGKELISIYHPSSPYKIFDPTFWWSDSYDPLHFGRDFDFSRTFFEQFHELNLVVPKAAIQNAKSENSAYTNYSAENKNCYLCVGTGGNENCYYSARVFNSKFIGDSYDLLKCESCYECVHCSNLNGCAYSTNCHSSSDLLYCENCRGCHDCFGCADLDHARYFLFNEELGEKEYRDAVALLKNQMGTEALQIKRKRSKREDYTVRKKS